VKVPPKDLIQSQGYHCHEEDEFAERRNPVYRISGGAMNPRTLLILIVGLAGVVEDLARRRISNWTSGGALVGGLIVNFAQQGWTGALHSLLGAMIGFAVFLIFYLLGGMGGGDVKLMAGFGALLGDSQILSAAMLAAIAGGLMAVGFLAARAVARIWKTRTQSGVNAAPSSGEKAGESMPYAPAITAGAWLALIIGT
jgi:prepilin peptidase CpaA